MSDFVAISETEIASASDTAAAAAVIPAIPAAPPADPPMATNVSQPGNSDRFYQWMDRWMKYVDTPRFIEMFGEVPAADDSDEEQREFLDCARYEYQHYDYNINRWGEDRYRSPDLPESDSPVESSSDARSSIPQGLALAPINFAKSLNLPKIQQPTEIPDVVKLAMKKSKADAPIPKLDAAIKMYREIFGENGDTFPKAEIVIEHQKMETFEGDGTKLITFPVVRCFNNAMMHVPNAIDHIEDAIADYDAELVQAMEKIPDAQPAMDLVSANSDAAANAMANRFKTIHIAPMEANRCEVESSAMQGIPAQAILHEAMRIGHSAGDILCFDGEKCNEISPSVVSGNVEFIPMGHTPDQAFEYAVDRRAMWSRMKSINRFGPHFEDMQCWPAIISIVYSISQTAVMAKAPMQIANDASEKRRSVPKSTYQEIECHLASGFTRSIFDKIWPKGPESQSVIEGYLEEHILEFKRKGEAIHRFSFVCQSLEIICDADKLDARFIARPTAIIAFWNRIAGRCGRIIRSREAAPMPSNRNSLGSAVGFRSYLDFTDEKGDEQHIEIRLNARRIAPIDYSKSWRDLSDLDARR